MSQKKLTLPDWIKKVGRKKCAQLLDVDSSTVRHWQLGYGIPKAKQMLAIKRLTKGELTCDAMIETHFKNEGK